MFDNNKTIVGLFGNDQDMEKAITQLQAQGFSDDNDEKLQIINKQHLQQAAPGTTAGPGVPPAQAHNTPIPPAGANELVSSVDDEATRVERSTFSKLTDFGLDDAEAEFYARQVARGSSVVVLETDKERASEATSILERFNARTVTA